MRVRFQVSGFEGGRKGAGGHKPRTQRVGVADMEVSCVNQPGGDLGNGGNQLESTRIAEELAGAEVAPAPGFENAHSRVALRRMGAVVVRERARSN